MKLSYSLSNYHIYYYNNYVVRNIALYIICKNNKYIMFNQYNVCQQ